MGTVQAAIREGGIKHLGGALVDSGIDAVFLEIENGISVTERIKTPQRTCGVKICKHLRRPYLVETQGILLDNDEGIGHEAGFLEGIVAYDGIKAVGRILPVTFIPYKRIPVKTHKRVQIAIFK